MRFTLSRLLNIEKGEIRFLQKHGTDDSEADTITDRQSRFLPTVLLGQDKFTAFAVGALPTLLLGVTNIRTRKHFRLKMEKCGSLSYTDSLKADMGAIYLHLGAILPRGERYCN